MRVDILNATLVQRRIRRKWYRKPVQSALGSTRSADFAKVSISGTAAVMALHYLFSQDLAFSCKLSSKTRNGLDILPRCHTRDKSHVACLSAIGTITTLGILRCEIKLGSNEIAPSFAHITRLSARLLPCSAETNRGRKLPNRLQNWAIV